MTFAKNVNKILQHYYFARELNGIKFSKEKVGTGKRVLKNDKVNGARSFKTEVSAVDQALKKREEEEASIR